MYINLRGGDDMLAGGAGGLLLIPFRFLPFWLGLEGGGVFKGVLFTGVKAPATSTLVSLLPIATCTCNK